MHLDHKPGEQMEVDWAGDTAKVTDPETGNQTPAYLFIAVLSCSGYAYVEAFGDQGQESWITGHVHAYRYFGGATRILTPDNLKTGPPWKRGSHSQSYLPGDGGTLQHLYPASQSTSPKRQTHGRGDGWLCIHLGYRCLARRHIFHFERFESGSLEETGGTQQPAIPKETRKPQKLF